MCPIPTSQVSGSLSKAKRPGLKGRLKDRNPASMKASYIQDRLPMSFCRADDRFVNILPVPCNDASCHRPESRSQSEVSVDFSIDYTMLNGECGSSQFGNKRCKSRQSRIRRLSRPCSPHCCVFQVSIRLWTTLDGWPPGMIRKQAKLSNLSSSKTALNSKQRFNMKAPFRVLIDVSFVFPKKPDVRMVTLLGVRDSSQTSSKIGLSLGDRSRS
jgi:hypothetical protein